jgi:hypothetical protein
MGERRLLTGKSSLQTVTSFHSILNGGGCPALRKIGMHQAVGGVDA